MRNSIVVGRANVQFTLRSDERVTEVPRFTHDCDEVSYRAEVRLCDGSWLYLGTFHTESLAQAIICTEREDFSAAYGA